MLTSEGFGEKLSQYTCCRNNKRSKTSVRRAGHRRGDSNRGPLTYQTLLL